MCAVNPTTGQSNLTKRPHCCRTWTVQLHSPGGGNVHPPSNTCFPRTTVAHTPNSILVSSAVFAQLKKESPLPLPPKIPSSHGGVGPPSSTWFLGPTQVHNLNGISISSTVFAQLMIMTDRLADRLTDRPCYSVCKNRLHLRMYTVIQLKMCKIC